MILLKQVIRAFVEQRHFVVIIERLCLCWIKRECCFLSLG